MFKEFTLLLLLIFLVTPIYAQTSKSKYCPDINKIKIIRLQKPFTHVYSAYNDDRQYFISQEYVEDAHNGPAPPVFLNEELTNYESSSKKLSCVYYAYARDENSRPTLVNLGGY